jgi:cytochrome c
LALPSIRGAHRTGKQAIMRSQVWSSAFVAAAAIFTATSVNAASTPEQAKTFAERAAAYIEQVGEETAFADFTRKDGGFVDGELYVFCYDRQGVNKAHGGNASLVGRNLLHIKDPDGAEPNARIVKMGFEQGRGWVEFKWPNPVTKRIEDKSAYVIRTYDVVCGVGYYKG